MTIRVLIVDDEELVRTGLRLILEAEPDLTVVGTAPDGGSGVAAARRFRPDVVLMDIRMPGLDGLAATRRLLGDPDGVPCKVVVLTTFDVDEHVYEALRAGASGFLLKDVPADQLVHAIRVAAAGEALLAPSVTRRLIAAFTRRAPAPTGPPPAGLADLTSREVEVLELLADGLSNAEIGRRLFVGEATVKTHVARVLAKLGVRDRVQAVIVAFRTGLVPVDRDPPG
ncbi:response regulator [Blastococcus saxobsidens]|uniref:Two-component response regulator n=1 Tax=Blastococcus saxobsidens (strain DD2) TaxID=1146883 RepID=H6RVD0_BLASD|nr:response regulator transcription factor [Blastococcus saxobsidens]CCG02007.1 Two-component response regulator [Blastococcus saxobsidens DD2]